MNIGLDARTVFSPRPRGTGRNLFDAYRLMPTLRPTWTFTLYHQREARECALLRNSGASSGYDAGGVYGSESSNQKSRGLQPARPSAEHADPATANQDVRLWPANVRTRRLTLRGDRFDAWFQLALPWAAWRDGVDLLHFPANAAPACCPVPYVVTIHDLIPLKIAEELPPRARRRFQRGIARAVRRAVHIITPSRATRDDLCADFRVAPERITVIPWAPDRAIGGDGARRDPLAQEALRTRYQLERPWLLNFSGGGHRKNATALLRAFAQLAPQWRQQYQLVLVGCESSRRAALEALATELGIAADCRVLGFVSHEDLPGLLRGARGLLMPSLYEGFGLPILDAFACGVPVLTSDRSSMPEVAGDAAVYCDPMSPASIAAGIAELLRDDVAERLVRRGGERVRAYTWEATARAMCAVYELALAQVPHARRAGEVATCR